MPILSSAWIQLSPRAHRVGTYLIIAAALAWLVRYLWRLRTRPGCESCARNPTPPPSGRRSLPVFQPSSRSSNNP